MPQTLLVALAVTVPLAVAADTVTADTLCSNFKFLIEPQPSDALDSDCRLADGQTQSFQVALLLQ
jgi:hypothetical protein